MRTMSWHCLSSMLTSSIIILAGSRRSTLPIDTSVSSLSLSAEPILSPRNDCTAGMRGKTNARNHRKTMVPATKRNIVFALFTKNPATYTDMVGTTLLRKEIVAAHAIGTYVETLLVGKVTLFDGVKQLLGAKEL